MVQMFLPIFQEGINQISTYTGYERRNGYIYYYVGQAIIGKHAEEDREMFYWMAATLCESENSEVKQMDIVRAFNVSKDSIKRAVKKYRKAEGSAKIFFTPRKGRGAAVLTEEKIKEIEEYLEAGTSVANISKIMEIKADTIKKGITSGRIKKKPKIQKKIN